MRSRVAWLSVRVITVRSGLPAAHLRITRFPRGRGHVPEDVAFGNSLRGSNGRKKEAGSEKTPLSRISPNFYTHPTLCAMAALAPLRRVNRYTALTNSTQAIQTATRFVATLQQFTKPHGASYRGRWRTHVYAPPTLGLRSTAFGARWCYVRRRTPKPMGGRSEARIVRLCRVGPII